MSQIEVPDWVARKVLAGYLRDWDDCSESNKRDLAKIMAESLTAALGAWVVPEKFQVRTRCPFFGWGHWYSIKSQQERDDHFNRMNMGDWIAERRDLYDLRQEKPE